MMAAAVVSAFIAFGLLAATMDRHTNVLKAFVRPLGKGPLRVLGAGLLFVSLLGCMAALGGWDGLIAWWGVLTATAGTVVLLLTLLARRGRPDRKP